MVEEKKMTVDELSKSLSEISRNTGKRSFKISYTATDGNTKIHESFQRFCFERANNEYLAGIGKLLELSEVFQYLIHLDERISLLENSIVNKEVAKEEPKEEDSNGLGGEKTF